MIIWVKQKIVENFKVEKVIFNCVDSNELEQKLKNENIKLEKDVNEIHYEVDKEIRNTIKKLGGTMPENLPIPNKSLKELERENKNQFGSKKM